MKTRSASSPYEIDGHVYNAYQEQCVVEFDSVKMTARVVSKYDGFMVADEAVRKFNEFALIIEELKEKQLEELKKIELEQTRDFYKMINKKPHCTCENCSKE